MEYQCGGHLREYDSSTDCLYMFFDLGYEPWLELGPGLSQPEAFEKAQAWIWSSLSRPKPGHSRGFRAKPGLHITKQAHQQHRAIILYEYNCRLQVDASAEEVIQHKHKEPG